MPRKSLEYTRVCTSPSTAVLRATRPSKVKGAHVGQLENHLLPLQRACRVQAFGKSILKETTGGEFRVLRASIRL